MKFLARLVHVVYSPSLIYGVAGSISCKSERRCRHMKYQIRLHIMNSKAERTFLSDYYLLLSHRIAITTSSCRNRHATYRCSFWVNASILSKLGAAAGPRHKYGSAARLHWCTSPPCVVMMSARRQLASMSLLAIAQGPLGCSG